MQRAGIDHAHSAELLVAAHVRMALQKIIMPLLLQDIAFELWTIGRPGERAPHAVSDECGKCAGRRRPAIALRSCIQRRDE